MFVGGGRRANGAGRTQTLLCSPAISSATPAPSSILTSTPGCTSGTALAPSLPCSHPTFLAAAHPTSSTSSIMAAALGAVGLRMAAKVGERGMDDAVV